MSAVDAGRPLAAIHDRLALLEGVAGTIEGRLERLERDLDALRRSLLAINGRIDHLDGMLRLLCAAKLLELREATTELSPDAADLAADLETAIAR